MGVLIHGIIPPGLETFFFRYVVLEFQCNHFDAFFSTFILSLRVGPDAIAFRMQSQAWVPKARLSLHRVFPSQTSRYQRLHSSAHIHRSWAFSSACDRTSEVLGHMHKVLLLGIPSISSYRICDFSHFTDTPPLVTLQLRISSHSQSNHVPNIRVPLHVKVGSCGEYETSFPSFRSLTSLANRARCRTPTTSTALI